MERMIRCECGFVARGDTDEDVIVTIKEHMGQDHPDILEEVTDEDLQDWIELS